NKAFVILLLLFIYESLRGLLWNGMFPLFILHVVGLKGEEYTAWMGIFHFSGMVCATLFTPVWTHISKKIGNYKTWIIAYALQIPIGVIVYLLVSPGFVYTYFILFLVLQCIGRASGFLLDSIKTTAIDYDEFLTGLRRDASLEASWRLIPRYFSLPGNAISYYIVSKWGYRSEFPQQPSIVVNCISVQAALLPSITSLGCLCLMYMFPINDEISLQINNGIEQHRKGISVIDPITKCPSIPPQKHHISFKDRNT